MPILTFIILIFLIMLAIIFIINQNYQRVLNELKEKNQSLMNDNKQLKKEHTKQKLRANDLQEQVQRQQQKMDIMNQLIKELKETGVDVK